MEEEYCSALLRYLQTNEYPPGLARIRGIFLEDGARALNSRAQGTAAVRGLYYRSTFKQIVVLKGREEAERVFTECHLAKVLGSIEEGTCNCIAKIKDRLASNISLNTQVGIADAHQSLRVAKCKSFALCLLFPIFTLPDWSNHVIFMNNVSILCMQCSHSRAFKTSVDGGEVLMWYLWQGGQGKPPCYSV